MPADCRLLSVESLEVDESSLTGESLPVDKQTDPTPGMPLAERRCMAYAGTTVLAGSGRGVVTAIGARTVTRRADVGVSRSGPAVGLTNRLRELTRATLPASIGGGALVTVAGLLRGTGLRRAVTGGVAVAVAAVPEGLPLVATLAQQAAARRLTAAGVLVRAPRSIEALGRVDVVCFDKTGTQREQATGGRVERVDGWDESEILEVAARSALGSRDDRVFHSTDAAVVDAAQQALDDASVFGDVEANNLVPFRSGRPYSAALLGRRIALKGSPEFVTEAGRDPNAVSAKHVQSMAGRGLRVVAVAQRELSEHDARRAGEDSQFLEQCCSEGGLEAVGLLGLSDTLRPEATQLVRELRGDGRQVRVLTGDHPTTAAAVATELGGLDVAREDVVTGPDWENFSRAERRDAVRGSSVFARVTPEQKVEIVQALETDGRVCAMVGDGANDAAAIRVSSVGIGGVASTDSDPARGAADIVLLDGRVGGLTDALDEGSQLWRRVRSAVGGFCSEATRVKSHSR